MSRDPQLPPGWVAITTAEAAGLLAELQREMAPSHPLRGASLMAVARRSGNDDVLFRHVDAADRYSVVHLTWASRRETSPEWPGVEFQGTLAAFLAHERAQDTA